MKVSLLWPIWFQWVRLRYEKHQWLFSDPYSLLEWATLSSSHRLIRILHFHILVSVWWVSGKAFLEFSYLHPMLCISDVLEGSFVGYIPSLAVLCVLSTWVHCLRTVRPGYLCSSPQLTGCLYIVTGRSVFWQFLVRQICMATVFAGENLNPVSFDRFSSL